MPVNAEGRNERSARINLGEEEVEDELKPFGGIQRVRSPPGKG